MESLFLENKLGGQETDELATNIGQCVTNSQSPGWTAKNAARDWMRRCLKKWLASSLCGWHNHLGWQGANTKTVTRGIQNVGSKFQKLSHWDFIDSQLDLKRPISTIYSVPLFLTSNFKLDWLHVVDLGVTLACLGNCFHYLLPRLGKNASEQLPQLLLLIKQYYMVHDIKDGINNLTAGMFRASPSVSPKLKVKGAEARSLVRFVKELVEKYCNESQAFDSGVKWVVICLNQCHDLSLHNDSFHAPSCQKGCAIFLLQYKSLEEAMGTDSHFVDPETKVSYDVWVGTDSGLPCKMNWKYRDEEAGGTLARMARSRGGFQNPWSVSSRCLQRFCCDYDVPILWKNAMFQNLQQQSMGQTCGWQSKVSKKQR